MPEQSTIRLGGVTYNFKDEVGRGMAIAPTIIVTAPTGSTVTCSNGNTTMTAQENNGTWTFEVNAYGTWTVSGSLGSDTNSVDVVVDEVSRYDIEISFGIPASSIAVGSTVSLKVNNVDTDFLVVHQGKPSSIYDDSCNGTWLLMKDCYESRQWHSSSVNDYANSTIHSYLNSTFLNLFDAKIKNAVKDVKIPYRAGSGYGKTVSSGANGLPVKIFLPSCYEVGFTSSGNDHFCADGAKLSYFDAGTSTAANNKRIAKLNGSSTIWWLRSPYCDDFVGSSDAETIGANGSSSGSMASNSNGIRPALILPSNYQF